MRSTSRLSGVVILVLSMLCPSARADTISAPAVGWGNTFVPGLGATLRGYPARGLLESTLELGTFYGGTFYAQEGAFSIDGTVLIPDNRHVFQPLLGQVLQEFGLKYHMYNTFYHYQQASLEPANQERDLKMLQPLYKGDWEDVLSSPFHWKYFSSPWVFLPVIVSTAYLTWQFQHTVQPTSSFYSPGTEDALYAGTEMGVIPLGSAFGEETYFRGFMQREFREYTNSAIAGIILTTIPFTLLHPVSLRPAAALGGLYYGYLTTRFNGDLGPALATHFWVDFVDGFINYMIFRKAQGKAPPWQFSASVPF